MTLAQRLRYARDRAGLSQSALARAVQLRPQTIQAIEAGLVARPRALLELARVLAVRSEWLLWEQGQMEVAAVAEPSVAYQASGPPISDEALALAHEWMALSKPHRRAVSEMIRALREERK